MCASTSPITVGSVQNAAMLIERAIGLRDVAPAEIDAAGAAFERVVADDRGDDLDAVRACRGERIVDLRERSLVELAERRLDACRAADRVAHRLAANDRRTELARGGKSVVDLVVARIVGPGRVRGPVAGDAEPLDVGSAKPKRRATEKKMCARLRDKRASRRLRRGGREQRGDGDDQLHQDVTILGVR